MIPSCLCLGYMGEHPQGVKCRACVVSLQIVSSHGTSSAWMSPRQQNMVFISRDVAAPQRWHVPGKSFPPGLHVKSSIRPPQPANSCLLWGVSLANPGLLLALEPTRLRKKRPLKSLCELCIRNKRVDVSCWRHRVVGAGRHVVYDHQARQHALDIGQDNEVPRCCLSLLAVWSGRAVHGWLVCVFMSVAVQTLSTYREDVR